MINWFDYVMYRSVIRQGNNSSKRGRGNFNGGNRGNFNGRSRGNFNGNQGRSSWKS